MTPAEIAVELQSLQRRRSMTIRSRIMLANALQANVASTIGYHAGLEEADRKKRWKEAGEIIKAVQAGGDHLLKDLILVSQTGIDAFHDLQAQFEKPMVKLAKQLPVAAWVAAKEQRCFGLLFLAIVIGETGDLANYPNPGKVWRRLGCAPFTFNGQTRMGATWKSGREGKLPKEAWEEFGYSPRRRSTAYLIGEGIVKQNFVGGKGTGDSAHEAGTPRAGPYRQRYDDAKAKIKAAHPDYPDQRCHRHGMLLATKLLLKNLWIEWNGHPPMAAKLPA